MLAMLDFGKALDETGTPIEPLPEYRDTTFRYVHLSSVSPSFNSSARQSNELLLAFFWPSRMPTSFPCKISPRTDHATQLVREAHATASN